MHRLGDEANQHMQLIVTKRLEVRKYVLVAAQKSHPSNNVQTVTVQPYVQDSLTR